MPILNFQKQFADLILSGQKNQTIRAIRKYPIKSGDKLYLYTGLRTKNCHKIIEAVCRNAFNIKIYAGGVLIKTDRSQFRLNVNQLIQFAKDDGFENWEKMVNWFEKTYGLPFHGQIIYWY